MQNGLSETEIERLALMTEECGEVLQVIGKILRHGYIATDPNTGAKYDNRAALSREVGDFAYASGLMCEVGDLSVDDVEWASNAKAKRCLNYLHHQDASVLEDMCDSTLTRSMETL